MYEVYVLKSENDGKLYIGHTKDLSRRLKEHNNGFVKSTINRRPFDLVYKESCKSKEAAISKERYFKTGFGRKYLKQAIPGTCPLSLRE